MSVLAANVELAALLDREASRFQTALGRLAWAKAHRDAGKERQAKADLAELVTETLVYFDLLGRRRIFLELEPTLRKIERFAAADPPASRKFRFVQAIEDLVRRTPTLVVPEPGDSRPVYEIIAERYARGDRIFAVSRAVNHADEQVTERVQLAVERLMKRGISEPAAVDVLADMTGWTESYANTVYRTNASTAYTNGRFEEAKKPHIKDIAPAFELVTMGDVDVRREHAALHGLLMAVDDPRWETFKPPLNYG